METFYAKNKTSILQILNFSAVIVGFFVTYQYLLKYIAPFLIGWLLSRLLIVPANFLHKRLHIGEGFSAFLTIIGFFALLYWAGQTIIKKLFTEAAAFFEAFPNYVTMATDTATDLSKYFTGISDTLPDEMQTITGNLIGQLSEHFTGALGTGIKDGSMRLASGLPTVLMILVVSIISLFFFLKDFRRIRRFIRRQIPESWRPIVRILKKDILDAVWGYIKAQLIIMCIVCIICSCGLFILKLPFAFLIGVIISIIDALPVFGSGFILWPWAAFHLVNNNYYTALGLMIIYGIVMLTRQLTEPKIIGSQIGLHPLVTLASIYIGIRLFGVLGIIAGPLFVIVVKSFQKSKLLPGWK